MRLLLFLFTFRGANPNAAAVNAAKAAAAQIKNQINHTPGSPMPPPGIIKPVLYSQPSKLKKSY